VAFTLDPVGIVTTLARGLVERHLDQEGPVWKQVPGRSEVELEDALHAEPTGKSLIGQRGIDVAIAEDVLAARLSRPDDLVDELGAGCREESSLGPPRIRSRIFSPRAVPPGSRVSRTCRPSARSRSARRRTCVDLPEPSTPSNVMNIEARPVSVQ
jgi:hypothetical protein